MGRRASSPPRIASRTWKTCTPSSTASWRCWTTTACSFPSRTISFGLLDTLQYDTVYHEHLRYYSLASLKYLLEMHDLEVFHARPIPSHGGSIRVYAARKGQYPVQDSVAQMLAAEPRGEAMAKRLAAIPRRRGAVEAAPAVDDPRSEGKGRPHRRHQRAVAREHAGQLCRSRRGADRLRLRDPGLAQDRQVHAGHRHPGGGRGPAVRRPARLRHHLLLAHCRRTGAETARQGLPRPVHHAACRCRGRCNRLYARDSLVIL